ncbi:MAG: family 43 glycosylhydrolase [Planctomycetota bacterium]
MKMTSNGVAGMIEAPVQVTPPAPKAPGRAAFRPGTPTWLDTAGEPIQAHGGGMLEFEGIYYWHGEQRGDGIKPGVRCYSSTDLRRWMPHGVMVEAIGGEATDLQPGCIIERPKVVHNASTGKFVMWFHLELAGLGYDAARTAVAVADAPIGPFKYLRSFRPHHGVLPINAPIEGLGQLDAWRERVANVTEGQEARWAAGEKFIEDVAVGQMARDMTVFVDNDGVAYHVHASEENRTLHIARLTDDYLDFSGEYARVLPGGRNEASAVFVHEGRYYMLASGLTGWAPNEARSYVSDSMYGPWESLGNPCVGGPNPHNGIGPDVTFGAQSTHVLEAPGYEGQGKFIAMFDVWHPEALQESRYVWLPLTMEGGRPIVRWHDAWDESVFDG